MYKSKYMQLESTPDHCDCTQGNFWRNDWRLTTQEEYLLNKTVYQRHFATNPTIYQNRRCCFCYANFGLKDNDLREGFYEPLSHSWICRRCYDDFSPFFGWRCGQWDYSVMEMIPQKFYSTFDLNCYGKFPHIGDVAFIMVRVNAFFPQNVPGDSKDAKYSLRVCSADRYAYEAYLEVVIRDEFLFMQELRRITELTIAPEVFPYDNSFVQQVVQYGSHGDRLILMDSAFDTGRKQIIMADIQKVIYSKSQQRIIYVSIGVDEGGAANTKFLSCYFSRFNIDPTQYAMSHTEGTVR